MREEGQTCVVLYWYVALQAGCGEPFTVLSSGRRKSSRLCTTAVGQKTHPLTCPPCRDTKYPVVSYAVQRNGLSDFLGYGTALTTVYRHHVDVSLVLLIRGPMLRVPIYLAPKRTHKVKPGEGQCRYPWR